MAGAYTDAELPTLDDLDRRQEAVARMDIRQRHLGEFEQSRELSHPQLRVNR